MGARICGGRPRRRASGAVLGLESRVFRRHSSRSGYLMDSATRARVGDVEGAGSRRRKPKVPTPPTIGERCGTR